MIQPATLKIGKQQGQKVNTTYFTRDAFNPVLMLQLRMLMLKLVILAAEVHNRHWLPQH